MQLVRSYDQPGRPSYATWLATYNVIRKRRVDTNQRMSLPASQARRPMAPSEYLGLLKERARNGDQEAVTELGNYWRGGMGRTMLDRDELIALGCDVASKPFGHPMAVVWS